VKVRRPARSWMAAMPAVAWTMPVNMVARLVERWNGKREFCHP
jgi:hypothetical protein